MVTYCDYHSLRHVSSTVHLLFTTTSYRMGKCISLGPIQGVDQGLLKRGMFFSHPHYLELSFMNLKPWFLNGQSCGNHYIFVSESFNQIMADKGGKFTSWKSHWLWHSTHWLPKHLPGHPNAWNGSHHIIPRESQPTPRKCLARLGPSRPHLESVWSQHDWTPSISEPSSKAFALSISSGIVVSSQEV